MFTMCTLVWILTRFLGYICLFVLRKVDKLNDEQLNLYAKLSIIYYEEFFIATYFMYHRATVTLKSKAYKLEDYESK